MATLGRGPWQVRAVLSESQMADVQLQVGTPVEVRREAAPGELLRGVITSIAPTGSRSVDHESLTLAGGGDIVVDPRTGHTDQPFFEVTITLNALRFTLRHINHGMTCRVRFEAQAHPIGRTLLRRAIRFTNTLLQS